MMNLSERGSVSALLSGVVEFKETVWFDPIMDHLIYLKEDVSYRADRVDPGLTLLWHPQKNRLVGLKIKGLCQVYNEVVALGQHDHGEFLRLVDVLCVVMVGINYLSGFEEIENFRLEEWRQKYDDAKLFVNDVQIPSDLSQIALAA